jgi:hypothetical protein
MNKIDELIEESGMTLDDRQPFGELFGVTDYRRRESLSPKVEIPTADSLKRLVSFIAFDRTT